MSRPRPRWGKGPLQLSLQDRNAYVDGQRVALTAKEFDLLQTLMERPDRVLTRTFLLSHVWGYDMELQLTTKAVDMVVVGLRRKLGGCGDWIETVKGYGYRFGPHREA